ncbi:hypothetical protein BB561_006433, partial [Smittium simulii]
MIFFKPTISAYFLAQALLQISVSADEPRTKVQPYNGPAVTHSVNGAVTICNENGCVTTLNKDIIEDHSVNVYPERKEVVFTIVKCKSDIYPECKEGSSRCATDSNDPQTCFSGKWVTRKCSGNERCKINKNNVAECTLIVDPTPPCMNGVQQCNTAKSGIDECINGVLRFKQCPPGSKCIASSESKATCGPNIDVAECKEGSSRCATDSNDPQTCFSGKWVTRKCSGNERCKINKNNVAECTLIVDPTPPCMNGVQQCNTAKSGIDECINGVLRFKQCPPGSKCIASSESKATCGPNIDVAECKEGSSRCATD